MRPIRFSLSPELSARPFLWYPARMSFIRTLILLAWVASPFQWAFANEASLEGDEPIATTETSVQTCFDSYDCIRSVEHCLNRQCERQTRPCHFNYECGGADTCQRGVCRR
jgi:hypothetical protein